MKGTITTTVTTPGADQVAVGANYSRKRIRFVWGNSGTPVVQFNRPASNTDGIVVSASGNLSQQEYSFADYGAWMQGDVHVAGIGGAATVTIIEEIGD